MTSPDHLETMVTSFYKDLFNATDYLAPFCLTGAFPRIEAGRMEDMGSVPSDQEIHDVLRSMGGFKAPGPDGIQAVFYQTQWHVVGPLVCQLVRDCFAHPDKIGSLNETLITLIPKVEPVVS